MENIQTIRAESRYETGKKIAKNLRKKGMIPAIIYGGQEQSLPISLNAADIKRILKSASGENSILRIQHDEKSQIDAMLKDIQYDYLSEHVIHVDLIRIDLNKPVEVEVQIVLEGEPIGVKLEDGILDFITREVMVHCLPTKIPREIRINIADLHANHSIKVENLPVNPDYQFISPANTVICAVSAQGKEELTGAAAAAEAATAAAPGAAQTK